MPQLSEAQFNALIDDLFLQIENKLNNYDPDIIDCSREQGNCTLTFGALTPPQKLILSKQTSTQQLWLAWAKESMAIHFNFDAQTTRWIDDKNKFPDAQTVIDSIIQKNSPQA
jgi:iron donor protein CyaY